METKVRSLCSRVGCTLYPDGRKVTLMSGIGHSHGLQRISMLLLREWIFDISTDLSQIVYPVYLYWILDIGHFYRYDSESLPCIFILGIGNVAFQILDIGHLYRFVQRMFTLHIYIGYWKCYLLDNGYLTFLQVCTVNVYPVYLCWIL